MACDLLTGGIAKDCENNMGGLANIWILDLDSIASITASNGNISAITLDTASPALSFFELEFNRNTSEFQENELINVENGSAYFEQIINLVIPRRDVIKRNVIKTLAQRDVVLIVKDLNGIYWYVGEENGALLTELTSSSGLAKADGSKYTLQFKAEELAPAQTITEAAVLAVI